MSTQTLLSSGAETGTAAVCPSTPAPDSSLASAAGPGPVDSPAPRETLAALLSSAPVASEAAVTRSLAETKASQLPLSDDDLVVAALVEELQSVLGLDRTDRISSTL
jgi:hypothetical protein